MKRLLLMSVITAFGTLPSSAFACTINEIQRVDVRNGICSQGTGLAAIRGCTVLLLRSQMADQFEQIDLARRCGFKTEADKLESYYQKTTPLVVQLYQCVDDPISRPTVEKQAHEDTDKKLAGMAPGCSEDLKAKIAKRLPSLISTDEKSLQDMKRIAEQMGLSAP